ncbi:common pilus major fimbrillin subunit EcpA, partial [Klebsiella pneumoniae]|uniref:common pilus major fimbrillin subunit EcpA n=1 Tax=Klebsiella pneumoniae TaxID=573 RepID=UPI003F839F3D
MKKPGDTVRIDPAKNIGGGTLSALAKGYTPGGRTPAQVVFTFSITSGPTNGPTAVTDYSTL